MKTSEQKVSIRRVRAWARNNGGTVQVSSHGAGRWSVQVHRDGRCIRDENIPADAADAAAMAEGRAALLAL